jgi:hypothetical protein
MALSAVAWSALFVAVTIWIVALLDFDGTRLRAIPVLGLAAELPTGFYVALGVLIVSFAVTVSRRAPPTAPVVGHLLALIAIWHATPAILYGTPRYPFTYKHVGIADFIQRTGTVDRGIDAYFNWPGFFGLGAFLSELAGLDGTFALSVWGPVAMNLLILVALVAFVRALDDDRRLAWLAVWFFLLSNWIGQDYFAPQALGFALHLALLAGYVGWFVRRRVRLPGGRTRAHAELRDATASPGVASGPAPPRPRGSARQRAGVLVLLLIVYVAIVASHQLTPFMTLASVAGLVVLGLGRARLLPVVMAAYLVAWFVYVAVPYLSGHLPELLASVGRLLENIGAAGSILSTPADTDLPADRRFVLRVRQGLTLAMGGLAVAGGVRRLLHGRLDAAAIVLVVTPLPMIVLQPYGGEMILRIYLFCLPVLAWFAAALFFPEARRGRGPATPILIAGASAAMAGGMALAYYGNESMNYVAPDEVRALERLYEVAPADALVVTMTANGPIRHARYDELAYVRLAALAPFSEAESLPPDAATELADALRSRLRREERADGFVVFLRSERANARLFGELPGIDLRGLRRRVATSPAFVPVVQNEAAAVYRVAEGRGVAP